MRILYVILSELAVAPVLNNLPNNSRFFPSREKTFFLAWKKIQVLVAGKTVPLCATRYTCYSIKCHQNRRYAISSLGDMVYRRFLIWYIVLLFRKRIRAGILLGASLCIWSVRQREADICSRFKVDLAEVVLVPRGAV